MIDKEYVVRLFVAVGVHCYRKKRGCDVVYLTVKKNELEILLQNIHTYHHDKYCVSSYYRTLFITRYSDSSFGRPRKRDYRLTNELGSIPKPLIPDVDVAHVQKMSKGENRQTNLLSYKFEI